MNTTNRYDFSGEVDPEIKQRFDSALAIITSGDIGEQPYIPTLLDAASTRHTPSDLDHSSAIRTDEITVDEASDYYGGTISDRPSPGCVID